MQLLINWVDHQVIPMPHGPDVSVNVCPLGPGQYMQEERNTEAGDLWVAGGPCGSYEDVNGAWISAGVCTEVARPGLKAGAGSVLSSQRVNIYTVQGKFMGAWDREVLAGKASSALPAGTWIIKPVLPGAAGIARVYMCGHRS
jgi:hypothetical protein